MQQGVTIWLTGLSGAGKSTLAELLLEVFHERQLGVELLDGDIIRTNLSKGLGFSKEDRDINLRRVAFVANLLTRNHTACVVACISPYRDIRRESRELIGEFVEVFVNCPLEVCESRDVKGLYAKARAGEIKGFTGIDDPYEEPESAEITLNTDRQSKEESLAVIVKTLEDRGYLSR